MIFSIRDLFLVTLIVALAVGWWLDRSMTTKESRDWKFRAETLEGYLSELGYKSDWDGKMVSIEYPDGRSPASSAPAPNPPKP